MKPLVISLGGSLISTTSGPNTVYLEKFQKIVKARLKAGQRIFLVVGGGALCRQYQEAARKLHCQKDKDLDWIGIYASRLNAQLLRAMFPPYAYLDIICFPEDLPLRSKSLIVGAGGRPGGTTDGSTVRLARAVKAKTIVNLTNIDYVYSADPKKDHQAKPLKALSWADYLKIIPAKRVPGGNYPFDPVASRLAQEADIRVIIMNGENLDNFEAYLRGKEWKGTIIR